MSNGNNGKPPPLPPDYFKKGGGTNRPKDSLNKSVDCSMTR